MALRVPKLIHLRCSALLSLSRWLTLLALGSTALAAPPVPSETLELHSHLFMRHGMYPLVKDPFFGPPTAKSYRDRFAAKATAQNLDASGNRIVVASLYAHPVFTGSLRDAIRAELREAHEFLRQNPRWTLARSAAEARSAIARDQNVLILHLEGASGILETEDDFREWVVEGGIRIVTPLHLTDDSFGGCAFLRGIPGLSSPFAWIGSRLLSVVGQAPRDEETGVRLNPNGLSARGEALIDRLLAAGVWIDLAHASDRSLEKILPKVRAAGQPFLHTHTSLRRFLGAERGISDRMLRAVAETRGFIGLMPSETMLEDTVIQSPHCLPGCEPCRGSVAALAEQFAEAAKIIDPESIALGSDHQGGIDGLAASCRTGTSLDRAEGLREASQTPEIWRALEALHAPIPHPRSRTLDRFLEAWSRVKATSPALTNGARTR